MLCLFFTKSLKWCLLKSQNALKIQFATDSQHYFSGLVFRLCIHHKITVGPIFCRNGILGYNYIEFVCPSKWNECSKYIHEAEYRLTTFQDALQSPIPNSSIEKSLAFLLF